jgi:hypothetical protein
MGRYASGMLLLALRPKPLSGMGLHPSPSNTDGQYWSGMGLLAPHGTETGRSLLDRDGIGPILDQQREDQSLTEMGLATFRKHSGPARWDRNAATTIPDPYRPTKNPRGAGLGQTWPSVLLRRRTSFVGLSVQTAGLSVKSEGLGQFKFGYTVGFAGTHQMGTGRCTETPVCCGRKHHVPSGVIRTASPQSSIQL